MSKNARSMRGVEATAGTKDSQTAGRLAINGWLRMAATVSIDETAGSGYQKPITKTQVDGRGRLPVFVSNVEQGDKLIRSISLSLSQ